MGMLSNIISCERENFFPFAHVPAGRWKCCCSFSLKRKSMFIIFLKYFGLILPGQDVVPGSCCCAGRLVCTCWRKVFPFCRIRELWYVKWDTVVPLKHQDCPKNSDPKGLLQLEVFQKYLLNYYSHQEAFLYKLKISWWFFKCNFSACVRLIFIAINL